VTVLCQLAGHGLSQLGIDAEPARLGSSTPLVGPVVGVPGLVAAIGLAVAGDLSVDALISLSDPCRDQLDRVPLGEPVSDLDPIILRQVARADRGLGKAHAASVNEPQRPAAQRHTHFLSGRSPRQASPDQLEVAALDRCRHLVRCEPGHLNPFTPGFATTSGIRPLYPVIYLDALVVKVKDGAHVRNKAAHIAVGVDVDGIKHVLGIWVQTSEGAKFWAGVCAELANRGIKDVLIVCCDGLTGFPEAIEATWPHSTVQTCVVHLIRAAMRFVNWHDRRTVAVALKPIYQAADADTARIELEAFKASELGRRNPHTVATFENAWERFIPFLAFPPMLRRVIYTTNAIESLNYQLRKIIKNRGHFPNDDAVIKLLWLAICTIEDKRARDRAKEAGLGRGAKRKADGHLVEGQTTTNWKQALAQLALAYPERINPHL
jgi:hypothetical protein